MSERVSIYEIPTDDREAFAATLKPSELREAFEDVAILNAGPRGDHALLEMAENLNTFTHILEATDLETAQKFAAEALADLVPAVIQQINGDDKMREHLRRNRHLL